MKKVIKNQWFLWKLCFKVCPGYMIYHLYDGFRYQGIIFLEHVLGIRYVLHCAEFHEPFWKAFAYIGAILLINMIQIIPDGYFIHGWTYKAKPMLYRSLKEKMYEKAAEIDLSCYDDPKYYNDFVLAVAEAESSIDRFLKMCNRMVPGITVIVTTGAFYIMTDATGILFVLASFVLRFFVFYLNDYAKELRLHPKVGDKLEKEFEETNDEIAKEQKRVGLKRTFLNFTRDYVVGDFIMDGLYITYLVFKATVLKSLAYSDAVVLFNRTSSLRRGFANIADVVPMAQENSLYIDKIRAFLDYKPKMELNVGETVPSNNAELSLKHVSFKYSEDADETLKDITLKVKPGEKIAIVGYNGAGKTTLIKLLMRLYDPTEGTITYHGKDIKDYKPCDYRRRIGVVFQDYQMYGATLLENVLMTDSKAGDYSEEAAKEALERAGFSKRLQTLPHSLDTQVTTEFDKDGINFSGGESQKIAISRAFYKDADILIMDEPSSALDPIAEYELNKAMESAAKGKTVFYISHRLSTTRDADRIILLEKGCIVEEGTHESLLEMNGKYAEMWRVQAGRYETA